MDWIYYLKFSIGFFIFTFLIPCNNGRQCVSCTTETSNDTCLHIEKNETKFIDENMIINCTEYCTIRRQEYADDRGGIASLNRSCETEFLDTVIVNGYFIFYLRSCKQNLCNVGDGTASFGKIIEDLDDDTEVGNFTAISSSGGERLLLIIPIYSLRFVVNCFPYLFFYIFSLVFLQRLF